MIYRPLSIALRTTIFYAVIAGVWILFSDQALASFISSPQTLTALQTYKGWAFVGVTALLLYIFLHRQFYDLEHYVVERAHREENLRQSEYRFRMLFEQNNDAIFLVNLERVVLMANQRAAEIFGYSLNELIGMNIQQLVAPEARAQTQNVLKRLLAGEKIPVYERLFVKKDGTRLLAEVNVDMVRDLHGKPLHIQSILRDITQRKQAEETVRHRAEELNALQATLLDVTSPQPLPTLLHLIVERAANLLRSSGGGLYLTEPEYRRVRCVVSYKTKRDYTGTMLDYGVGAAGHVAQSGEPVIIDDYAIWSGRAKVYDDDQPFQSVMSAPLLWQGNVTGVIHLLRENTFEKFTQEELDLLVLFANHAAVAVENARLYDALDAELSERVRAEAASQQSQAQLAGIVTSAMDAIISIDAEQRIVLFNSAAETVFRCAAAEAIGQPLEKFIPERFRANHAQHVRDFASSGITNRSLGKLGTVVGLRSDGVEFPIEASISQTHIANGDLYTVILRDITERVRAENALRESEQRYRVVVENALVGMFITSLKGEILYLNDAARKILEYDSIEEMTSLNAVTFYKNPSDRKAFTEQLLKTGRVDNFEGEVRAKTGKTKTVNMFATLEGDLITGLALDVTERVWAEEMLRESEERYRQLFENSPIGIYRTTPDGRIIASNPALVRMLGFSSFEELATRNLEQDSSDAAYAHSSFKEQIEREGRLTGLETVWRKRDGTPIFIRENAQAIRDHTGAVLYYDGTIEDVTERVRAEETLHQTHRLLETVFDNTHLMLAYLDPQFNFLRVNRAYSKADKREESFFPGRNHFDIYPNEENKAIFQRVVDTGEAHFSFAKPFEYAENTERGVSHWDWSLTPIKDANGKVEGLILSLLNVTERVQADEKLRESEERYRTLVDFSPYAIAVHQDGKIAFANQSVAQLLGAKSIDEVMGKPIDTIVHPDNWAAAMERNQRLLRGETTGLYPVEDRYVRFDGSVVPVQVTVTPSTFKGRPAWQVIALDITERKRAEESKRQHNQQINLLYEASHHLNRTLDLDKIYQTVLGFVSSIVSCDSLVVSAFDPDTKLITCRALWVDGKQQDVSALPAIPLEPQGHGTQSVAIRMAHSLLLNDYQARVKTSQSSHYVRDDGVIVDDVPPDADIPRSAMIVPLMLAGQVVGVIQVFSYQLNAYTDNQLKILESLASHIASAQQNALLYTERARAEQQAADSEAKLHALFSAMRDVVLTIDKDGIYREVAPTNPGLLIRPPHELLGKSLADVFLPLQAEELLDATRQVLATQQVKYVEYELTISGKPLWFSTAITPMSTDATVWVARDITERKLAETRIQLQIDRLSALRVIDQAISSSFDLRVTLSILLNQVMSQLHADAAAILLLNPQLQTLQYSAGSGFRTKAAERVRLHLGDSYAGRAVLERQMISASQSTAGHDSRFAALKTAEGFTTYFCVPLITKGNVVGVLEIFHRAAFESDSEWLSFLEMLAGQAAIAIDNANLFQNLQRSNIDLMLAYDTTLEGWSRALDLRDKETEGHSQRVTILTLQLARAMELSEEALLHIRRGALLHDIGKMGVPDSILLKPEKLTDDEWDSMRRHPQLAVDLLSPIPYLRPALDIPYCHHEKWDGTGYPRGLKGEQIPLAARIFAIADVWDALRSDRPYRAGWSAQKTRDHIKSLSGTHLDPKVVEVFLTQLQL